MNQQVAISKEEKIQIEAQAKWSYVIDKKKNNYTLKLWDSAKRCWKKTYFDTFEQAFNHVEDLRREEMNKKNNFKH
jgi:hypothetical protein